MKGIALWSGPRNLSTALMYFFAHRGDFKVMDEPFFGVFLAQSGRWRPSREESLAVMPQKVEVVLDAMAKAKDQRLFLKNMANHWMYVPEKERQDWPAIILFRDPRYVLTSYHKQMEEFDRFDLGYAEQVRLYKELQASGQKVYLQCSEELALHPEAELKRLCAFFELPFDTSMLRWPSGALPEDGPWAPYWYQRVHQSKGFEAGAATDPPEVAAEDRALYEECLPFYRILKTAYDEQIQSS